MKDYRVLVLITSFLLFLSCDSCTNNNGKLPLDVQTTFIPCGFMGDGESGQQFVNFNNNCEETPYSEPHCIKITYNVGTKGWAGIYWLNKDNPCNWGDFQGLDLSGKGFTKITFWAKGLNGNESVLFKAGGIKDKQYKDSFDCEPKLSVNLSNEWRQYIINLKGKDLSNVIGGFCWVANSNVTLYLDDIQFE